MQKIMIVDDELKMRILIRDFLKREGFETLEISNGEDAIQTFIENKEKKHNVKTLCFLIQLITMIIYKIC